MRRRKTKKRRRGPKQIAWEWMSRAVRLQGVIDTAKKFGTDTRDAIAECYTCGALVSINRKGGGQAGHFRSRGHGGGSGLYFDARAVRVQCAKCNAWHQGKPDEFREGLVKEYGEKTVRELERFHKLPSRWGPHEYPGLIEYWKAETMRLLELTGIRKWW